MFDLLLTSYKTVKMSTLWKLIPHKANQNNLWVFMLTSWIIHLIFWDAVFSSFIELPWKDDSVIIIGINNRCQRNNTIKWAHWLLHKWNKTYQVVGWEFILKDVKLGLLLLELKRWMGMNNHWYKNWFVDSDKFSYLAQYRLYACFWYALMFILKCK